MSTENQIIADRLNARRHQVRKKPHPLPVFMFGGFRGPKEQQQRSSSVSLEIRQVSASGGIETLKTETALQKYRLEA